MTKGDFIPNLKTWTRAALLAAPVLAVQVVFMAAQSELGFAPLAAAQAQDEKKADTRETRRTPALRNKVYEKLAEAQVAAEAKDWNTASKILNELKNQGGRSGALNSYELANVYNLEAFIAYSQENYAGALRAYENVIKQPDIPVAMETNTRFTIAQLYFVQEQWQKGIDAMLEWFRMTETPNANAYVLLAQGYYQTKDYNKALSNVEKAIGMVKEKGNVPKEQWYNLARFLYFEKGDTTKTVKTLEELLTHYPKKQYWVQLSHMYGEQKKDWQQLSAMETAHVQGMLDRGSELTTMAYLYLASDVPYKAGKVMDAGLKSEVIDGTSKEWELTGNAWRQAQEIGKAIPAMEQAAAKSDKGELYARLGNIYLDGDEYKKAVSALNKGLRKGGIKRPDTSQLVLGMAYFNLKEYDQAREAFQAAGRDERSAKYAEQWISYMDSELERQKQLEGEGTASVEEAAEPEVEADAESEVEAAAEGEA